MADDEKGKKPQSDFPRIRFTRISDAPETEDLLSSDPDKRIGHAGIAATIADAIWDEPEPEQGRPVKRPAIALLGSWGTGKSTIVNIVKAKLEEGVSGKPKCKVVLFDAWKNCHEQVRHMCLQTIIETVSGKNRKKRVDELSAGYFIDKPLVARWIPLVVLAVSVLALVFGCTLCLKSPDSAVRLDLLSLFVSSVLASGVLVYLVNNLSKERVFSGPNPATLGRLFKDIISEDLTASEADRLLIVTDNLDRLPTSKAREVWGSLQMFIEPEGVVKEDSRVWFLVPLDPEACHRIWDTEPDVTTGIGTQRLYSRQAGDEFLKKTFGIVLYVPPVPVTVWRDYTRALLNQAFASPAASGIEKEAFEGSLDYLLNGVFNSFSHCSVEPTAREIKAFVNQVGLLLSQRPGFSVEECTDAAATRFCRERGKGYPVSEQRKAEIELIERNLDRGRLDDILIKNRFRAAILFGISDKPDSVLDTILIGEQGWKENRSHALALFWEVLGEPEVAQSQDSFSRTAQILLQAKERDFAWVELWRMLLCCNDWSGLNPASARHIYLIYYESTLVSPPSIAENGTGAMQLYRVIYWNYLSKLPDGPLEPIWLAGLGTLRRHFLNSMVSLPFGQPLGPRAFCSFVERMDTILASELDPQGAPKNKPFRDASAFLLPSDVTPTFRRDFTAELLKIPDSGMLAFEKACENLKEGGLGSLVDDSVVTAKLEGLTKLDRRSRGNLIRCILRLEGAATNVASLEVYAGRWTVAFDINILFEEKDIDTLALCMLLVWSRRKAPSDPALSSGLRKVLMHFTEEKLEQPPENQFRYALHRAIRFSKSSDFASAAQAEIRPGQSIVHDFVRECLEKDNPDFIDLRRP